MTKAPHRGRRPGLSHSHRGTSSLLSGFRVPGCPSVGGLPQQTRGLSRPLGHSPARFHTGLGRRHKKTAGLGTVQPLALVPPSQPPPDTELPELPGRSRTVHEVWDAGITPLTGRMTVRPAVARLPCTPLVGRLTQVCCSLGLEGGTQAPDG